MWSSKVGWAAPAGSPTTTNQPGLKLYLVRVGVWEWSAGARKREDRAQRATTNFRISTPGEASCLAHANLRYAIHRNGSGKIFRFVDVETIFLLVLRVLSGYRW